MATRDERYDAQAKVLWIYRDFDAPRTLVPKDELTGWKAQLKQGATQDGRPLEEIRFIFADVETAAYNAQPLAFMGFGNYVGDLEVQEEYDGESPEFSTREDFGIT